MIVARALTSLCVPFVFSLLTDDQPRFSPAAEAAASRQYIAIGERCGREERSWFQRCRCGREDHHQHARHARWIDARCGHEDRR